jgi:hypothetical protein
MSKQPLIKNLVIVVALGFAFIFAVSGGAQAQEGQTFVVSIDNVGSFPYSESGVFNTPAGSSSAGPALPGDAYEFTFHAAPGENISFATMFVQSNDWFLAPDENGIPIYDASGAPNAGDVTSYISLWDAGTEGDEPVGSGQHQAPRQAGPNRGPDDPNTAVRRVLSAELPAAAELIQATLSQTGASQFKLRLQNVSGNSASPTPFAPGAYVVHTNPAPLFVNGQADRNLGLEAIAEDGSPAALAGHLAARSGINTPIAPAAWLVHTSPGALFKAGQAASAGLEALAEDGGPGALVAEQGPANAGAAAVGRGAGGPGPIFAPHGNYEFTITAVPGDHLSLAAMFVQSNDWFFGLDSLPLFDADGTPRSGNVTGYVSLFDAGTEVDEAPGYGPNQPPRQAGPNTGVSQGGVVGGTGMPVGGNFHITITPQ